MSNKTIFVTLAVVALIGFGLSLYNKTVITDNTDTQIPEPVVKIEKASIPDLIEVDSPVIDQKVSNKILIQGRARGFWFFEASFPYRIEDANGVEIARGPIMTSDEWMTENFVNFSQEIEFTPPATTTGKLILMKDNPSGEPQFDKELVIPIKFQ